MPGTEDAIPIASSTGLIDLEKELSCSICTDILYQPLTLLDCLHTFCGSCLKEWFGWQAQRAREDRHERSRRHVTAKACYTCPSCRAVVRETRPNAQVTTLLDMYLTANPDRRKNEADRLQIARSYTYGDAVLPKENRRRDGTHGEDQSDEDVDEDLDRRLMDEVREMSLASISGQDNARNDTQRQTRADISGRDGTRESSDNRDGDSNTRSADSRSEQDREARHSRAVNLGHQSSLRALLSPYNSAGMKEDIMKQIVEEGLLDDIDWDNILPEQEDELSERIAQAYKRRRRNRSQRRSRQSSRTRNDDSHRPGYPRGAIRTEDAQQATSGISNSVPPQVRAVNTRPPASRPHLLDAVDSQPRQRQHRRSCSRGRERLFQQRNGSYTSHSAARSVTDLNERPALHDPRGEAPRRASHDSRRSTDPEGISISERWRRAAATSNLRDSAASPVPTAPAPSAAVVTLSPIVATVPSTIRAGEHDSVDSGATAMTDVAQAETISISCDRCGRADIATGLHYSCNLCRPAPETYDLCIRCYRTGRGCLHWYGFGTAAGLRFERLAAPGSENPHILHGRKYRQLPSDTSEVHGNAALTLETGVFCQVCQNNADDCYFHCASCNDGEWGYCYRCVKTGYCCSHSLLPLALTYAASHASTPADLTGQPQEEHGSQTEPIPLTLATTCNACNTLIPATSLRLHCPACSHGDYDICFPCYEGWIRTNLIASTDGLQGWRRCLQGHRMMILQFDIGEGGTEWRRVVEDVVGGWAFTDDDCTSGDRGHAPNIAPRYGRSQVEDRGWRWRESAFGAVEFKSDTRRPSNTPPEVQSTKSLQKAEALWSFWPEEGKLDELGFPRGAIVEEVVDVNGAFAEGVYGRRRGLFPRAYVRII